MQILTITFRGCNFVYVVFDVLNLFLIGHIHLQHMNAIGRTWPEAWRPIAIRTQTAGKHGATERV